MARLFWLSDAQWALIEPHVPRNQPGARRVDGRRFRTLCVVDDFTREAFAVVVDSSLSGVRVAVADSIMK